ncbi:NAD(P)H-dependent flavin oxidoreductase [Neptunomonas japonica]|uniref:Nitronate monooxygenase n=1 Tax=Neptunomonas japonica JAMM 1380 TaxID=1441457 RepID=A0A7R6PEI1_9GAMM|nr:nitronate monooxygenase [Neptunomonas japonica]BBB27998.1 nitronate monooxygenase [Neptunomonas japonica JAMM 1380]
MNIKDLLGIELPIIQAPMAGVQGSELAIAVSQAGGLGSLPCAMLTPDMIRSELTTITTKTRKPFNVNFFCHTPPSVNTEREGIWRNALQPYFREYKINADEIPVALGRAPFSHEIADIIEEFQPPVVSFHFGLPSPDLITRVKSWGAKVISSATTVEEALWLEANGADAIIAQGLEAGGHRGIFLSDDITTQIGTFSLLPQIAQAVNIPVIAAGGIADAKGISAALSLGAAAVQVGTAYLLCPETKTSGVHRAALKSPSAQHTALTNLFSGRPARSIVNRVIKEMGPISNCTPEFPLATTAITALRSKAEANGSGDFSPLWCGQNSTGCKEIPAAELTKQLAKGQL